MEDQELVVLGAEDGIYVNYIKTLRGAEEGIQLYISPGTRRLLVQIGSGWLMLSRTSREKARGIYEQTIAAGKLTEKEFPRATFFRRLRERAELDVAFTKARDLVRPAAHWGGGMIAALVPTAEGHRQMAIGIGGPAERLQTKLTKFQHIFVLNWRRSPIPDDNQNYLWKKRPR
jgi:DNA-binding IclR family transcriptional regulator